ncbi:MAG: DUF1501 domain-containing protein, partial [Verrucomicrobiae bacterium]|nr:DUF1501 domain-containing protein [Verrucomicrobiae bacterium]
MGMGTLGLGALLGRDALGALTKVPGSEDRLNPLSVREPHYRARAKRVIHIFANGGPSQVDTFDYKPQTGNKKHPGSVAKFSQHGESGLWISELMPETAKHADKLCVINGMYADTG